MDNNIFRINKNKRSSLIGWRRAREEAHSLLKLRDGDANVRCSGNTWFYAFIKRHNLAYRKPQSLSLSSACITQVNILSWFKIVYTFLSGNDNFIDDYRHLLKDPALVTTLTNPSFYLIHPIGMLLFQKVQQMSMRLRTDVRRKA